VSLPSLRLKVIPLKLKHTFATSKAATAEKRTLIARWKNGIGEGAPSIHYGLPAERLFTALQERLQAAGGVEEDLALKQFIDDLPSEMNVARCALEMAYLDNCAREEGQPLHSHLNLDRAASVESSLTISYAVEDDIKAQVKEARDFSCLKLKVGFKRDLWFVDRVLAIAERTLRLDANGGWGAAEAVERLKSLSGYPIEFVEEPITNPRLGDLDRIKSRADMPIFLDESVVNSDDLERYHEVIDGVNVKLSKCGGINNALGMVDRAQKHGLRLLLGCMIETTVGVTAALHIASLFDYFDLDAIMLTSDDPFWGAHFSGNRLIQPDGPGIGVSRGENVLA
jgi:L-alanine-DL-glutamate epimerase-like enolase superfamily enzyme